jgi:hypothetical protein
MDADETQIPFPQISPANADFGWQIICGNDRDLRVFLSV